MRDEGVSAFWSANLCLAFLTFLVWPTLSVIWGEWKPHVYQDAPSPRKPLWAVILLWFCLVINVIAALAWFGIVWWLGYICPSTWTGLKRIPLESLVTSLFLIAGLGWSGYKRGVLVRGLKFSVWFYATCIFKDAFAVWVLVRLFPWLIISKYTSQTWLPISPLLLPLAAGIMTGFGLIKGKVIKKVVPVPLLL